MMKKKYEKTRLGKSIKAVACIFFFGLTIYYKEGKAKMWLSGKTYIENVAETYPSMA